jgi:staphylococcal nuclease domain-containing protein 1
VVLVSLAGVRTPRADTDAKADADALKLIKTTALQRDCQIEVVGVQEKAGALLGTVRVNKLDVATACSSAVSARRLAARSASASTRLCRRRRRTPRRACGTTTTRRPRSARRPRRAPPPPPRLSNGEQSMDVTVTEIVDGNQIYVQKIGEGTVQLEKLMHSLRDERLGDQPPESIKKGDVLLGQFTVDDTWYRARVEGVNKERQTYDVRYVDYGNAESLPRSRLRPLPASGRYNAAALPFQAHLAQLAFVSSCELDDEDGYGEDAARELRDLAFGRQLSAAVETKLDNVLHLSLVDPVSHVHINGAMLRSGLAVLRQGRQRWVRPAAALLAKLEAEQESARRAHVNRWKYGDVAELDEDDRDRR